MTSPFKYLPTRWRLQRVRVCVRACAVEIKPGMLRAACFFDVRAYGLTYKMATFIAAKELFNTVCSLMF